MAKSYMAIVQTPLGVWDSTASVCSGPEAEYRARRQAERAFVMETLPPFMTRGLDGLIDSYWRAAQTNGCQCIVRSGETCFAHVYGPQSDDRQESRAKLIAAAPDLYRALQWMVDNDETNVSQPGNEYFERGLSMAKAALAKARGETVK